MRNYFFTACLVVTTLFLSLANADEYLPVEPEPGYEHNRFGVTPNDILRPFRAWSVSFDSSDDDDGDGIGDAWRIPEWVAYEIRRFEGDCIPAYVAPPGFTDAELSDMGMAPRQDSYDYPPLWLADHPYWYERGDLIPPFIAARLGEAATYNSRSVLNAVPLRRTLHRGAWRELEHLTAAWAQHYGRVWVISGPVVMDGYPSGWLGEDGEMAVAIPDAVFKIVIRESADPQQPNVLAFLYPQISARYYARRPYPHQNYLVTVDLLEWLTGLDFFSNLPEDKQGVLEKQQHQWLWPVADDDFLRTCD